MDPLVFQKEATSIYTYFNPTKALHTSASTCQIWVTFATLHLFYYNTYIGIVRQDRLYIRISTLLVLKRKEYNLLQGSKQQIWIPFQSWMSSCLVLFSYIEIIITNLFPVALRWVCWLVRYMGNDLNFHTHIILAKTSNTDTSPNGLMPGHVLLKVAHHGC